MTENQPHLRNGKVYKLQTDIWIQRTVTGVGKSTQKNNADCVFLLVSTRKGIRPAKRRVPYFKWKLANRSRLSWKSGH